MMQAVVGMQLRGVVNNAHFYNSILFSNDLQKGSVSSLSVCKGREATGSASTAVRSVET